MNVEEAIRLRRSVRKYQQKAVEAEKLEALAEAVRLAPSASNSQPWKLILVDDPAIREQVAQATFSTMFPFNKHALEAPAIAVLAVERHSAMTQIGGWLKKRPYYLIDIGIAAAHFCLRATELGLGTCMLGWFDESAIKKILDVPRPSRIGLLITLGYAAEPTSPHAKTRKAAGEMSSRNRY
ncbi:MAG: nitroreductase family protein [Terracidiphilus sp.]|jgi:nitroreductase